MKRNTVEMIALPLFVLTLALGVTQQAQAQDAKSPYPTSMAPVEQYLMDRDAEIAMARSAEMATKLRSGARTVLSAT